MVKKTANNARLVIILSLALLTVFFFSPKASLACSGPTPPPNYQPPLLADRISAAPYVFDATAVELPNNVSADTPIKLNVNQYFKGSGPATVTIKGFGVGTDCREQIPVTEAIYFTWGDANTILQVGTFWEFEGKTYPVFGYRFTEPYSSGLAANIIKVSGHEPVLPVEVTTVPTPTLANITTPTISIPTATIDPGTYTTKPLLTATSPQTDSSLNWLGPFGAGILVVLIGVVVFIFLGRRRNR